MRPSLYAASKWAYLLMLVLIASLTLTTSYRDYHGKSMKKGIVHSKVRQVDPNAGFLQHGTIVTVEKMFGITYAKLKTAIPVDAKGRRIKINCKLLRMGSVIEKKCKRTQNMRELSAVLAAILYVAVAASIMAEYIKFFAGFRGIVVPNVKWSEMRTWKKVALLIMIAMCFVLFLNAIFVVDYSRSLMKEEKKFDAEKNFDDGDFTYGIQFKTAICVIVFLAVQFILALFLYFGQPSAKDKFSISALLL